MKLLTIKFQDYKDQTRLETIFDRKGQDYMSGFKEIRVRVHNSGSIYNYLKTNRVKADVTCVL